MVLLKILPALLLSISAQAYVDDELDFLLNKQAEQNEKRLCNSTQEYQKSLDYLRKSKLLTLTETTARAVADKISQNCDGASERFAKVLTAMKTTGLSDRTALAFALDFSSLSDKLQDNFVEIFTKTFLAEFFDYDYKKAVAVALELSRDYQGDAVQVREDFLALVKFCKDSKELDLPVQLCADYSIKIARLSQYYSKGIQAPFKKLFAALREHPTMSLNVKSSMDVSYRVLQAGPRAPENFLAALKYATEKDGLDASEGDAMAFALKMASRSHLGAAPPVYSPIQIERGLANVDSAE